LESWSQRSRCFVRTEGMFAQVDDRRNGEKGCRVVVAVRANGWANAMKGDS
jgi:hypothetical protein